jgi:rhodanese-related sulfurtransferase
MKNIWFAVTAALFFFTGLFPALAAAEFQLMSKEELKPQLGSSELIVIDARSKAQWESSQFKLPGAVWLSDDNLATWAKNTPKDKTLVIYCA